MIKKRGKLKKVIRQLSKIVRKRFALLEKRKQLSKVHDITHVTVVSICAREVAKRLAKGLENSDTIADYAEIAGLLHDIVRKATERELHGPLGAKVLQRYARMFPHMFKGISEEALNKILDVVRIHELSLGEIEREIKNWPKEWQIVARAVVIGDKLIEASGERVIERRAFFVGNERLHRGDLQYLKKIYGKKAPLYAVAMECCMRLRARNIIKNYPKKFQPIVRRLHAIQEEFYLGLLRYLNLTEDALFEEMERIDFPMFNRYKNILKKEIMTAKSENRIKNLDNDIAESAAEWVMHFSKVESPEEAIRTFKPKGKKAKEWLKVVKSFRARDINLISKKIDELFK